MSLTDQQRAVIHALAREHGVRRVRLFGSRARANATAESDLDLLVEMAPDRSLIDHIAFQQALEAALGVRVDVVTEQALHPHIRDRVLEDAVPV
ncbi:MAG: nucleotidyltransferase [Bacteroidetes bacterium]|jgi:predicted nucleotidyltransferase|nr:nucleotidyltransferase [Bacteroidota bacterium]